MATHESLPDALITRSLVHTAYGPIHYEAQGDGPTLFAVHGLPGSSRDFRRFGARVAAHGVRLVAFDTPGFAGTEALHGGTSWDNLAAALDSACTQLVARGPFAIAAHSFGAHIAVRTAARNPRAQALVLLAPAGLRPHRALRRLGPPGFLRTWQATALGRALFHTALLQSGVAANVARPLSDLTLSLLASADFAQAAAAFRALTIPVLTARCADDVLVEPAIVDELAAALRHARPYRFVDGGHAPQKLHGAVLAEATARLLAQLGQDGGAEP